jgi:hypothetical protein
MTSIVLGIASFDSYCPGAVALSLDGKERQNISILDNERFIK